MNEREGNTQRLGIRLRRETVLEDGPLLIGSLLAEIELADGTSLADLTAAIAAGETEHTLTEI